MDTKTRSVLLAVALILTMSGCSERNLNPPPTILISPLDEPEDSAWTPSLSELWRAPVETPRAQILLDVDPLATALERDLVTGWAPRTRLPESELVWSIGHESILYFELEKAAPSRLELRCTPFMYPGATELTLTLHVNGEPLGELSLKDGFHDYEVQIPESVLRSGNNWLNLGYSRVAVPAEVLENSQDRRELAVGFRRIAVRKENPARLVEVGGLSTESQATPGWLQTQSGSFSQLTALPPSAQLEFRWLATANTSPAPPMNARVELETDDGSQVVWTRQAEPLTKPTLVTIDLSQFSGQAVRLRFVVEDLPEGSDYLWLEPMIRSSKVGTVTQPSSVLPMGNLVLIILDAAARDRLGIYGYPGGTTPELDSLAQESLVFDVTHSQAAYTLASTASLFTSLLPARHGVVRKNHKLNPTLTTLAKALREANFATGAFSANGFASPTFGMDSGFERFESPDGGAGPKSVANAEVIHLEFERWLDELVERKNAPSDRFFAYLHFVQPHEPYNIAPAEYYRGLDANYRGQVDGSTESMLLIFRHELIPSKDELERLVRLYDGNLRYADAAVGHVIKELRDRDLLERTMLIVMADHGEATGERGFFGHNYSLQEEVTAIPLLIHFPSEIGITGRVSTPAASIDIAPTALAALGVAIPDSFEGIDLLRSLDYGDPRPPRVIFSRSAHDRSSSALWFGDFKFVDDPGRTGRTLTRKPDLDGDSNLLSKHPITYAFLNRSRVSFTASSVSAAKPHNADISRQTREALEALGYLLE